MLPLLKEHFGFASFLPLQEEIICDSPTVRTLRFFLIDEEEQIRWGQAIYEEMADTPAKRRQALEWQMHLEEILAASGGVTGGT